MKTNQINIFSAKVVTLAVQGALLAMFAVPMVAYADDQPSDEVKALTQPVSTVELGAEFVSKDSSKFGEYNGLDKKGGDVVGNFIVRKGDAYNAHEGGDGISRWEIKGTDLGTTSREIGGTYSKQGEWDFGLKFDQLRHNISDTYQTPQQGAMGTNNFYIPQGFGIVDTKNPSSITSPAAIVNSPFGTQALTPTQQSYFQTQNVHSDRQNSTFTMGHEFDRQWNMSLMYNHLEQSGAKLISSGSDYNVKSTGNTLTGTTAGAPTKEAIQMLMNPTNYKTDTFNLALNWNGDKGHFATSYYVSQFKDAYNGLSFSNPMTSDSAASAAGSALSSSSFPVNGTALGVAFPVNALSTAPDNYFQQFNFNGGYNIFQATKLVGSLSYGTNTQNMAYINQDQMQVGGLPQSSLDGNVVTRHADLKLINQASKDLTLTTGIKFNDRDNRTASNTYSFNDLAGAAETSINTPLSNKKIQYELAADVRLDKRQNLHVGIEQEQIHRWCDNMPTVAQIIAATPGPGGTNGSATSTNYFQFVNSCTQVTNSEDNKLVTNYRLKATDEINLNTGYTYSRRRSDLNASFYNPMQANNQGYELPGYIAFFDASRTEQVVKAGANWQASEKLNMNLNGRYIQDDYTAVLGVQNKFSTSLNLDMEYSFAANTSASAYITYQTMSRDLVNNTWSHATATFTALPSTAASSGQWLNNLSQYDNTIGLNAKHGGLIGGKLDLVADLTYSQSTSTYKTTDRYTNTACTAPSTSGYACGQTPDIKTDLQQLKLTGIYKMDKASNVKLAYLYQNLHSDDYYYNAYQTGYTATSLMPTNQQAPSYSVNVVSLSYAYNF